jgi:hypothetical protein
MYIFIKYGKNIVTVYIKAFPSIIFQLSVVAKALCYKPEGREFDPR